MSLSKIASVTGRNDDDELFAAAGARGDGAAADSQVLPQDGGGIQSESPEFPLVGLWLLACVVIQTVLFESKSEHVVALWVGTVWGGWSGTLWLLSAVKNPLIKACLTAGVCAWPAMTLPIYRNESFIFYVALVGIMGLIQGTLFRAAGVPRWQRRPWRLSMSDRRQFHIGDLTILTTAAAVVFAAVRASANYDIVYWLILMGIQCGMVLTAIVLIKLQISRHRGIRGAMWFTAAVMAAALAGGMAVAESVFWQTAGPTLEYFLLYGNLFGAYVFWIIMLIGGARRAAAEPNNRIAPAVQSPAA